MTRGRILKLAAVAVLGTYLGFAVVFSQKEGEAPKAPMVIDASLPCKENALLYKQAAEKELRIYYNKELRNLRAPKDEAHIYIIGAEYRIKKQAEAAYESALRLCKSVRANEF